MKTLEEFREFYDTELIKDIYKLEEQRKKLKPRLVILCIITLCAIFGIIYTFIELDSFSFIPFLIVFFVFLFFYYLIINDYSDDFESQTITRIIEFIEPGLTYSSLDYVSMADFEDSQLFDHTPDSYDGSDLIGGTIDGINIEFSYTNATYKSGKYTNTIFDGTLFISDFNKNFQGSTIILPDYTESILGRFANTLQKLSFKGELVKLENPEFERNFVVYSDNQVTARYILTPSLMERILNYKYKVNAPLYLSFINSKLYIAIPGLKSIPEPPVFNSIIGFEVYLKYYTNLLLLFDIVNKLNLNTQVFK